MDARSTTDRLPAILEREIAVAACVDPRTVARHVARIARGEAPRGLVAERVARALADRGIAPVTGR